MVNFQGISVSLVSSITGEPFSEYDCPSSQTSLEKNVISKIIPYSHGHDFWVEYEAHEPLPPNAKFFFTFNHDQQRIASWDCVGKNGYRGKATFGIHFEGQDENDRPLLQRQLFRFPSKPLSSEDVPSNVFRIEVFRVQARRRLPIDKVSAIEGARAMRDKTPVNKFLLNNGGYLPKHAPKRYYEYQLLDPIDKPFIAFQFLYRDLDIAWAPTPLSLNIGENRAIRALDSRRSSYAMSGSFREADTEIAPMPFEDENEVLACGTYNAEQSKDEIVHRDYVDEGLLYSSADNMMAPTLALNDKLTDFNIDDKENQEIMTNILETRQANKLKKAKKANNQKALSILIDGEAFVLDQDTILQAKAVPTSAPPSVPAIFVDDEAKKMKTGKLSVLLKQKVRSSTKDRAPFSRKVQGLADRARSRKAKQ